jgi:hypothetical protein
MKAGFSAGLFHGRLVRGFVRSLCGSSISAHRTFGARSPRSTALSVLTMLAVLAVLTARSLASLAGFIVRSVLALAK